MEQNNCFSTYPPPGMMTRLKKTTNPSIHHFMVNHSKWPNKSDQTSANKSPFSIYIYNQKSLNKKTLPHKWPHFISFSLGISCFSPILLIPSLQLFSGPRDGRIRCLSERCPGVLDVSQTKSKQLQPLPALEYNSQVTNSKTAWKLAFWMWVSAHFDGRHVVLGIMSN